MTISEQSRHALFLKLESTLGEEVALTLMEHLPPVGWADVATKRDVDHLQAMTSADTIHLGVVLRGETSQLGADLRGEINQLGTDLRGEINQLGTDLRGEMGALSERMVDRMVTQTRTLVLALMGSTVSIAAVTLSASRLS